MIARGLGVVVGIKERDDEIKDMLLTDICHFRLESVFGIMMEATEI